MKQLLFLFILAFHSVSSAQSTNDSLWDIWEDQSQDAQSRLKAAEEIATSQYLRTSPDSAYLLAVEQYNLAEKVGEVSFKASALTIQGNALRLQGNPSRAVQKFTQSQKIYESLDDKAGVARNLHYIGSLHFEQGDTEKALEYFNKALKTRTELGDEYEIAKSYNSIGYLYDEMGDYEKSLTYHRQCLEIRIRIQDRQGESWCYNNMARVYFHKGDFETSEVYYLKSIALKEELNEYTLGETQANLGQLYLDIGRPQEALQLCQDGLAKSEDVGFEKAIRYNCECLYEANKVLGNSSKALLYHERFISMRDSVFNAENSRNLVQSEVEYEFQIKEALAQAETEKKLELAAEKEDRQQLQLTAVAIGAIILAALLGVIIFWLKKARSQKKIIELQVEIVDQKNNEILDSINYAKRIQSAILPPTNLLQEYLPNHFVLYKPKDIVAGDFYWIWKYENTTFFAAADCTGHGVPGAMVSVICNAALNRSVTEFGLREPGEILDKAREIVIQEFAKSEEKVKDGMDVALCALSGDELKFAGAHNPLWIIRNDELREIKADKQPIGQFDNPEPYTTHTIQVEKGDCIYIFTDGYVDQFGGMKEKAKKFKPKALRELLLSFQAESMSHQKETLDSAFERWKGDLEQVDDVCIIGVRV